MNWKSILNTLNNICIKHSLKRESLPFHSFANYIPEISCFGVSRDYSSTTTSKKNETETKKKDSESKSCETLLEEHSADQSPNALKDMDNYLNKNGKKNKIYYVLQENVAEKLATTILSSRTNPKAPIIEIDPGVGLLSKSFLNKGVEMVIGTEIYPIFHPYLMEIEEEYGNEKFQFFNWKILNQVEKKDVLLERKTGNSYKLWENEVVDMLSHSSFYNEEVPYSMLCLGPSPDIQILITYVLNHFPNDDPIVSRNRVEFFTFVTEAVEKSIKDIQVVDQPSVFRLNYSYIFTYLCIFFDVTFLGNKLTYKEFSPQYLQKNKKDQDLNRQLVKIQLKDNAFQILPIEHHMAFRLFLRSLTKKKTSRLIPIMEMYVAGSGINLLAEGYTMMERVADISPLGLVQLYKSMLEWPEYHYSHMKHYILMQSQGGSMETD